MPNQKKRICVALIELGLLVFDGSELICETIKREKDHIIIKIHEKFEEAIKEKYLLLKKEKYAKAEFIFSKISDNYKEIKIKRDGYENYLWDEIIYLIFIDHLNVQKKKKRKKK